MTRRQWLRRRFLWAGILLGLLLLFAAAEVVRAVFAVGDAARRLISSAGHRRPIAY